MNMVITWTVNFGPVRWTVPESQVNKSIEVVHMMGFPIDSIDIAPESE